MNQPTVGRIVHFVLAVGVVRPAIVVNDWGGKITEGRVNMLVFTDGSNDDLHLLSHEKASRGEGKTTRCTVWRTSVPLDESETPAVGTWHWPPRVP